MKQRDIKPCLGCGQGAFHHNQLVAFGVSMTREVLNLPAVRRQAGLEMMLGGNALIANAMGPDEDMTKAMGEPVTGLVCRSGGGPIMTELTEITRRNGYRDCLLDLHAWLRSQIGTGDTGTLHALNDELHRLNLRLNGIDTANVVALPAPAERLSDVAARIPGIPPKPARPVGEARDRNSGHHTSEERQTGSDVRPLRSTGGSQEPSAVGGA